MKHSNVHKKIIHTRKINNTVVEIKKIDEN